MLQRKKIYFFYQSIGIQQSMLRGNCGKMEICFSSAPNDFGKLIIQPLGCMQWLLLKRPVLECRLTCELDFGGHSSPWMLRPAFHLRKCAPDMNVYRSLYLNNP